VFGKDGTADETADKPAANNNAIGGTATTHKYTMMVKDDWTRIVDGQLGQPIERIPYIGGN